MIPLAETRDLEKSFGPVRAVAGVSLQILPGEVVGLLGANGAGKTSLIRCLLGLVAPNRGTVTLFGERPHRANLRRVGYVPQGLGLYADMSLAENLAFRRRVFGESAVPVDDDLARHLDTPIGQLPLGLQRRAAFVAALAHHPELLMLDEPTSGVGLIGRVRLWGTIREAVEAGAGALVTTHHLEEAEQCDRLVMLSSGEVVASGSLEDVINGRTAIEVSTGDQAAAFGLLASAGLRVSMAGTRLRLIESDLRGVERILGEAGVTAGVRQLPATLEEAFVALATR
jgi:ABC-2 type transport system ATP-binding protein